MQGILVDMGQGVEFVWEAFFLTEQLLDAKQTLRQVELSASINMAPSGAVSSHLNVGRMADSYGEPGGISVYRKRDLCCILHGFLFPLHTHTRTRARASHTSQDDSYNCRDRKLIKSLVQEGGEREKVG